jgi:hypothetical protein
VTFLFLCPHTLHLLLPHPILHGDDDDDDGYVCVCVCGVPLVETA